MGSLGKANGNSPDLILFELNKLDNLIKDKERELGAAQNEIKALKGSEFLKDKALMELSNELKKLDQRLGNSEKQIEDKNLEIKRLISEKKAALSAQFAAEATLRRIHANQKDEVSVSVATLIAPLEDEIKMCKIEISALHEDRKSSDRLMKFKESALLEAEKNLNGALERSLMVDNLQNQNVELKRQVEICLEENKLLEKTNRQKVIEIERLMQTIHELEECVLMGGKTANAVRDYQRQISEMNEERKTIERELAKARVCANRVATVVANEWKDEGDRVIPAKQWLEERKYMQGEIQRLKDMLAISERSAKAEAQLKDKLKLRLKTLEDSNNVQQKRSMSQPRASLASATKFPLTRSYDSTKSSQRSNSENMVRKNLWASKSKFYDGTGKEDGTKKSNVDEVAGDSAPREHEDTVSGFLYDKLQREVITLRKLKEEKDEVLSAKEDEIKLLHKKLDALQMRRVSREKEVLQKSEDNKQKLRTANILRRTSKPEVSLKA